MKRRIYYQGIILFLSAVMGLLLWRQMLQRWQSPRLDLIFDIIGVLLLTYGFLLRVSARGYKSEMSAMGHKLVTGGCYGICRNPMYLGTFLIGIGIILVVLKVWVMLIFAPIYLAIYIPQMKREEKHLEKTFGRQYEQYKAEVPLFFPRISKFTSQNVFFRLEWVKKELHSLAILLPLISAVEAWEDSPVMWGAEYLRELTGIISLTVLVIVILTFFYGKKDIQGKSQSNR